MTKLTILTLPDKRLKTIAKPVEIFNEEIQSLADKMLKIMYEAPGIGLAATQVDKHIQLVVIDISEEKNQPLCLINPKIINKEGSQVHEEGCLSVPGIYAKVKRSNKIEVAFNNTKGEKQTIQADELLAICIQHEIDHLNGIVFLDHLSPLKRKMALKKLEKESENYD